MKSSVAHKFEGTYVALSMLIAVPVLICNVIYLIYFFISENLSEQDNLCFSPVLSAQSLSTSSTRRLQLDP